MSIKLRCDLEYTLKETCFDSNSEVLEIAVVIEKVLQSPFIPSFFAISLLNNVALEPVSSNAFVLIYLVLFEMVIGIICKNVFFSKLLLFKLFLAMFWFVCVVIWVNSWSEV